MNDHELIQGQLLTLPRHGFHLEITSIEEFTAFVALIRGDTSSAETVAAITRATQKISDVDKTLGEATDKLTGISPDPATT
jgi:hypothetical protein